MSVVSGSLITETELNAAFTGSLNVIRGEAANVPSLQWVNLKFDGYNANSPAACLSTTYVFPDDYILDEAHLICGNLPAGLTGTFNGDNFVQDFTIMGSGSTNAYVSFPRYFASGSNPYQVCLRGSGVTITISTNYTGTGHTISAGLGLRTFRRIE